MDTNCGNLEIMFKANFGLIPKDKVCHCIYCCIKYKMIWVSKLTKEEWLLAKRRKWSDQEIYDALIFSFNGGVTPWAPSPEYQNNYLEW